MRGLNCSEKPLWRIVRRQGRNSAPLPPGGLLRHRQLPDMPVRQFLAAPWNPPKLCGLDSGARR